MESSKNEQTNQNAKNKDSYYKSKLLSNRLLREQIERRKSLEALKTEFHNNKLKIEQAKKRQSLIQAIFAALATVGVAITANMLFTVFPEKNNGNRDALKQIESINSKILDLDKKNSSLAQAITSITTESSKSNLLNNSKINIEIRNLSNELNSTKNRLSNLETSISDDPGKALSIPLLKKDLELITKQATASELSQRAAIERVYDMQKWLVGLTGTFALGLLGTALANLFSKRDA